MAILNNHELAVLEAHSRIVRANQQSAAVVTLHELDELLRVYRLATSEHMLECLLRSPGELLNALFPIGCGG